MLLPEYSPYGDSNSICMKLIELARECIHGVNGDHYSFS